MTGMNIEKSFEDIKKNLMIGKYDFYDAPCVLQMEWDGVYVHKDGLEQNVTTAFENHDWGGNRVKKENLKPFGHGDFDLYVSIIGTKYLETREQLDELLTKRWEDFNTSINAARPIQTESILSLSEVLKKFPVELSCDMNYYLANKSEMEEDLGRKLASFDEKNEDELKKLEGELYSSNILRIFGSDEDDGGNGELLFRDFRILYDDGNDMHATAKRGSYYFHFYHMTS